MDRNKASLFTLQTGHLSVFEGKDCGSVSRWPCSSEVGDARTLRSVRRRASSVSRHVNKRKNAFHPVLSNFCAVSFSFFFFFIFYACLGVPAIRDFFGKLFVDRERGC